jgi:hypothetical protein
MKTLLIVLAVLVAGYFAYTKLFAKKSATTATPATPTTPTTTGTGGTTGQAQ